eukprot:1624506-Prymnesium_polylepis.1
MRCEGRARLVEEDARLYRGDGQEREQQQRGEDAEGDRLVSHALPEARVAQQPLAQPAAVLELPWRIEGG